MPEEDKIEYIDAEKSKVGIKADLGYLLTKHLNRISEVSSFGNEEQFIRCIRVLEKLLQAYYDEVYLKEIEILNKKFRLIERREPPHKMKDKLTSVRFDKAMEKWGLLMELMRRKSLLPEKQIEDIDADESEAIYLEDEE